jgi:serine/threonine protein kinase
MVIGLPPFYSKNRAELFEKIKFTHPKIMPFVSDKLRSLFHELFQKKPEDRLCSKTGANEIKSHPWFENINWNDVLNKKIHPPFVPTLKTNIDVSHFDSEFTECEI